jgi:DNA-binding NarL/FixJ family response regulator
MDPTFGHTSDSSVSVLIADAHANRRRAFRLALLASPAVRVVGEATDVDGLLVELETRQPRVLIVSDDLLLQRAVLVDVHLQGLQTAVRTLVVTTSLPAEAPPPPLRDHLWGCLGYSRVEQDLAKAVMLIDGGEMWFTRRELAAMVRERAHRPLVSDLERLILQGLTSREIEVVQWVMQGRTNKQIAQRLNISDLTVKTHVQNIFKKCGLRRRGELPGQTLAA